MKGLCCQRKKTPQYAAAGPPFRREGGEEGTLFIGQGEKRSSLSGGGEKRRTLSRGGEGK